MLERVLKQNFLAVSAQGFVLVFGVFFTVAFTYILSKEEFGLLATFISLTMLAVNLSDIGVQQTIIQFFGKSFFSKDGRAGFYLRYLLKIRSAAAFAVCAITFAFSNQLAETILHSASLAYVFQWIAGTAFVYTFIHFLSFVFSAVNKYEFVSIASFCMNAFKLAIPLAVIFLFGASVYNAIVGVSISFALSLIAYVVIFLYFFRSGFAVEKTGDARAVNGFLFYSALTAFISQLFSNSDILLINYFTDSGQVALYRAAQVIMNGVLALIPLSATFLYSFFVELEAQKRQDVQARMFGRMLKYGAMFLIPLTFYLFFFSADIMHIYPKGYAESVPALQIFSLAIVFVFIQSISTTLLYTKAMVKKLTALTLVFSSLVVLLNFILIPSYGFSGAAIAYLIAYASVSLAAMTIAVKSLELKIKQMHVIKPILISLLVMLLLSQAKNYFNSLVLLALAPFLFAAVYAVTIDAEDRELARRIFGYGTQAVRRRGFSSSKKNR